MSIKFSELPSTSTLVDTNIFPLVVDVSGTLTSKQSTLSVLKNYVLEGNAATTTKLATARTINGISFDGSANIVVTAVPPIASDLSLGGIKVGNNLSIDPVTGILSAANSYSLPIASSLVLGGVKVDASSITIDAGGIISVPAVTTIGQTNGIAQLGGDGKLVASQIPTSLTGAIIFKGTWDASTNTPTLADGVGTNGWEYAVAVGGTINLGSGNITFIAGDFVIYNGTIWQRIPSNTIAEAGTLTGTTLNATVVNSSLISVGTLTNLTVTNTITGSVSGNAGTVTNGVVTTGSYSDPTWLTLTASKVGLGNVTNESKATMFASPTFTGTVSGVTATHIGLGNVTNESKAIMFASPTFTGTVSGVTATMVGLGNVTNESKATMFASPTFTGVPVAPTATAGTNDTQVATTQFVRTEVSNLVNGAGPALDTLKELADALGSDANFSTTISTALGLKAPLANPTFTGTVSGVTATMVGLGNVTNESKATMFASPTFTGTTTLQQSTEVLNLISGAGGVSTFTVTSDGSSAYVINGVNNPTLNLVRGVTYTFNVNASGHPFWIKTAQVTGTGSDYSTGVTNNGDDVGTITFAVPLDAPSTLYYICQYHSGMVGTISISDASIVVHDFATGAIWYHSDISANFTANFTNVPTTNDRTLAVVLVLNQGATAYIPNAVQINGVAQTILWQGTVLPVGTTNRVNVVSFTLVRTGSAWTVIGALTTYGAP